jgi:hypothetical protein
MTEAEEDTMNEVQTIERTSAALDPEAISLETLECRRNTLENEMFEVSGYLSQRLHEVEDHVTELQLSLHRLVCLSGRTPIEDKTTEVVRLVGETFAAVDTAGMADAAERVGYLKTRVEKLEAAILERFRRESLQGTG